MGNGRPAAAPRRFLTDPIRPAGGALSARSILTGAALSATLASALPALALGAALALAPLAATAQSGLEPHLGPLAPFVELGDDGRWTAQIQDGWFTLSNTTDPGAITYYWANPRGAASGAYELNLNVVMRGQGEGTAYAGFLFNFRAADQYLGIVIGDDGVGHALVRSLDGFNIQPLDTSVPPRFDGTDILQARVEGGSARFSLNGAPLAEINNTQPFSTQLGILAAGTGLFGFTDFTVTPLP